MDTVPKGCRLHPDCFTCPFPDCRLEESRQYEKRSAPVNWSNPEERRRANREYQRKRRREQLQREFPFLTF